MMAEYLLYRGNHAVTLFNKEISGAEILRRFAEAATSFENKFAPAGERFSIEPRRIVLDKSGNLKKTISLERVTEVGEADNVPGDYWLHHEKKCVLPASTRWEKFLEMCGLRKIETGWRRTGFMILIWPPATDSEVEFDGCYFDHGKLYPLARIQVLHDLCCTFPSCLDYKGNPELSVPGDALLEKFLPFIADSPQS